MTRTKLFKTLYQYCYVDLDSSDNNRKEKVIQKFWDLLNQYSQDTDLREIAINRFEKDFFDLEGGK